MMMFLVGTFNLLNTPIVGKSNLPGDVGFDPLNLASLDLTLESAYNNKRSITSILNDHRDAELKHWRLAMLASFAWPLQEKFNPVISEKFNLPSLIQNNGGLSPSLINGGLFEGMIPNFIFMFFILSSMLETYGIQLKQDKSNWIPGDYGWRVTIFSPESKTILFFTRRRNLEFAYCNACNYYLWYSRIFFKNSGFLYHSILVKI